MYETIILHDDEIYFNFLAHIERYYEEAKIVDIPRRFTSLLSASSSLRVATLLNNIIIIIIIVRSYE